MFRLGELVGDGSWQSSVDDHVSIMYLSIITCLEGCLCFSDGFVAYSCCAGHTSSLLCWSRRYQVITYFACTRSPLDAPTFGLMKLTYDGCQESGNSRSGEAAYSLVR